MNAKWADVLRSAQIQKDRLNAAVDLAMSLLLMGSHAMVIVFPLSSYYCCVFL